MKDFPGTPRTLTGLVLRISQCIFAVWSIASMATTSSFFHFTAFCYLIASMSWLVIWSFVLALLDAYAWMRKVVLYNAILGSLFVVGDWELVEAPQRDHASPYIEEPLAMELVPPPTKICQGERPMLKRFLRFLASRAYEDFVYMVVPFLPLLY